MRNGYCASRMTGSQVEARDGRMHEDVHSGTAAAPNEASRCQFLVCPEHGVAGHAQRAGERPCRGQPRPSGHAARFDRLLHLTDDLQRERLGPIVLDRELALQLDLCGSHVVREYRRAGGLSP